MILKRGSGAVFIVGSVFTVIGIALVGGGPFTSWLISAARPRG